MTLKSELPGDAACAADDHGRAASDTALALLAAMHKEPAGVKAADLSVSLGLPLPAVQTGLRGLKKRGRANSDDHGTGTLWFTAPHFKARAA